jgi:YesN/AraC family two-component response regulator
VNDEFQPRILVVDDEPEIVEVVCEQLFDLAIDIDGFKFRPLLETADNGISALKRINANRFDLVVSDIRMPGLDGLEIVEQLSQIEPTTKVILISGHADKNLAIRALRLGVFDLLEKPWQSEMLRESVRKASLLAYKRRLSEIEFEKKMARYAASMPPDRYQQLRNALRSIMLNQPESVKSTPDDT